MDFAAEAAMDSRMMRKIGCAAVVKGRVVSKTCNSVMGTKLSSSHLNACSTHAEMAALEDVLRQYDLLQQARAMLQQCREKGSRCYPGLPSHCMYQTQDWWQGQAGHVAATAGIPAAAGC